jgi:hypothetical protein
MDIRQLESRMPGDLSVSAEARLKYGLDTSIDAMKSDTYLVHELLLERQRLFRAVHRDAHLPYIERRVGALL